MTTTDIPAFLSDTTARLRADDRPATEVITTALASGPILRAIADAGCIPVIVDIPLGSYVGRADLVVPAITEQTAAIVLPRTFGNRPDALWIEQACDVHQVGYREVDEPGDPVPFYDWWEGLTTLARELVLPERVHTEAEMPEWTGMPLVLKDDVTVDLGKVIAACAKAGIGARLFPNPPELRPEFATLGTWVMRGSLPAMRCASARGFIVTGAPSTAVLTETLRGVLG